MNWHDVAPPVVATAQIKWERGQTARRMAACGIPDAEIAERLGMNFFGLRAAMGKAKNQPPPIKVWSELAYAIRDFAHSPIVRRLNMVPIAPPDLSEFTLLQLQREVRLRKKAARTAAEGVITSFLHRVAIYASNARE